MRPQIKTWLLITGGAALLALFLAVTAHFDNVTDAEIFRPGATTNNCCFEAR